MSTSPTFPLATLAPVITSAGISGPAYSDVLNSLIASMQSIFGSDILLTPDTQEYQQLAIVALAISDTVQAIINAFNSYTPSFGQGAMLSAMVKINGLQRQQATNSTATLTVVGVAGTKIFAGVAQDTNGNLWNLAPNVTIPGGGSIAVQATCQTLGAVQAVAGSITGIFTPQQGWQSVTNAADAIMGAPIETDAALRIRQALSVSLPAQTPLSSIAAAIANIVGVTRSIVYENNTNATDANGAPAHSIYAVVQGGSTTSIAQTIEAKKSPGTGTFGTTSMTVNDPSGLPVAINFFVLTLTQVYVNVTVKAGANYVSTTTTTIQSAIAAALNALPIGGQVYYNYIMGVASQAGNVLGITFHVTALTIGTAPNPTGTVDLAIAYNAAAAGTLVNINVTVT